MPKKSTELWKRITCIMMIRAGRDNSDIMQCVQCSLDTVKAIRNELGENSDDDEAVAARKPHSQRRDCVRTDAFLTDLQARVMETPEIGIRPLAREIELNDLRHSSSKRRTGQLGLTEEPVKKGRGRPRKSDIVAQSPSEKKEPAKEPVELPPPESAEDTTETEDDAPPKVVKSPAGEKRAAAATEGQNDKSQPAPKRGRGRPPKAAASKKTPAVKSSSGRGRGRPKKNP